MPGSELAELLAVHLRTVQRYAARLRELNIPVEAFPVWADRIGFVPDSPAAFTAKQRRGVCFSLGLRALRQIGLDVFAPATQGALAKFEQDLACSASRKSGRVAGRSFFERNAWTVPTPAEHLMTVAPAIRGSHQISFTYMARNRQTHAPCD